MTKRFHLVVAAVLLSASLSSALSLPKLPRNPIQGDPINDLPSPSNVQGVVAKHTITITWDWQPPDQEPLFTAFGYEIKRNDGFTAIVGDQSVTDFDLAFGTHTYWVRARGEAKFKGKRVTHVSDWSDAVQGVVQIVCSDPPEITLTANPSQNDYARVSALRLHLVGDVTVPAECHIQSVTYHLDSGTGIVHTGPLKFNKAGHFDQFVNALEPDDEMPSNPSFTVSAEAEDEAGPNTSAAYTIGMDKRNPFAPH